MAFSSVSVVMSSLLLRLYRRPDLDEWLSQQGSHIRCEELTLTFFFFPEPKKGINFSNVRVAIERSPIIGTRSHYVQVAVTEKSD